jgi:hypothetical protein
MENTNVIVDAFINYFVEVRSARIRFWLKPVVGKGAEFINLPITALFFSAACARLSGMPTGLQYSAQLFFYLVTVLFIAGLACLLIQEARDAIGVNIRKFVSVVWIISTFGATSITIDFWLPWISAVEFLLHSVGAFRFSDVLAASIPAALVGLVIVGCNEHSLGKKPEERSLQSWLIAAVMLLAASIAGLAIMIRPIS